VLSTQAFSQTKDKHALLINDAEKRALHLMKPIDFSQQIIDAIKFPDDFTTLMGSFRLKLEKTVQIQRTVLMNKFLSGALSYTDAYVFVDSIKNGLIAHIKEGLVSGKCKAVALKCNDALKPHHHDHADEEEATNRAPGGPCVNPDFEMCDFTDWNMITGTVPYPSPGPFSFTSPTPTTSFSTVTASTPVFGPGSAYDQHYICTAGTDGIGGFPMVYPGGTCTAAIGDFTNTNYGASQITKQFMVSSGDAILTLNYAVCLQDAGHTAAEQPYFRMRVYDASGASITCAEYEAVAGDGQPGWVNPGTGWQYKPWTTVFIPLAPYLGQNVTVEFTVGDCAQGGHAGYAYVDASCDAMAFNMSAASVCAGNPITIDAPAGASSYLWSTGATTQSITVSTGGTYSVTVTPVTGSACAITLDTTVFSFPNPIAAFTDDAPQCAGVPINFTDASNPNGSVIATWAWDFGDGSTSALQNPTHPYAAAGTYTVTLTVTTTDGCTHTITNNVTINAGGVPTINPGGPYCNTGAPVILTSSVGGGTWSATCGACINATTGSFDPSLASVGPNTITYTVSGACSGSDTEVFTVQEVTLDNVVSTNVTCFGFNDGTITLTATGATQYSIDNGVTFQAASNFTGLGANTYPVLVENAIGCQATGSATITEPPQLTAIPGFQDETCFGACDGFVVVAPGGGTSPYNFSWSGPSGIVGTSTVVNSLCVGTYTVTVTDNNGCVVVAPTTVGGPTQVVITAINTTPELCPFDCQGTITIMASGGTGGYQYSTDGGTSFQPANNFINVFTNIAAPNPLTITPSLTDTVCIGQSTTISATTVGGTGAISFNWDNGLGAGASHLVDPPGTTTYNVTATDANGCSVSGSVLVFEHPPLNVVALTNTNVCPGFSAPITANGSGGNGGPYTYTWTNDIAPGTLAGQSQTVTPSTQTVYTVTLTDNCGTPAVTDIVTIGLHPLPPVNYSIDNNQGCTPVGVNFSNTTNAALSASCFWDFGDGTTSTNCSDMHVFTTPGCYDISLTVTTVNGCIVDTTIYDQICVFPYPIAEFSFGPQPADIFNPEINFTNLTIGGNTYVWDFSGLGSSTATNPSFVFPNEVGGIYPVCLEATNAYGCVNNICHDVIIGGEFLIYVPNAFTPSGDGINDIFLPNLLGEEPDTYEFMIFNRWGELIFYSNNKNIGWDGTHNNEKCKTDVYVWKVKVKSSLDHERKEFVGHVSLLK
jgi:large repetitive protein